jgi:hypothetical protein
MSIAGAASIAAARERDRPLRLNNGLLITKRLVRGLAGVLTEVPIDSVG